MLSAISRATQHYQGSSGAGCPRYHFPLIVLSNDLLQHARSFHQDWESRGGMPVSIGISNSAHFQNQGATLGRGGFTAVGKITRCCSAGSQLIKTRTQGLFPLTSSHTPAVNPHNISLDKIKSMNIPQNIFLFPNARHMKKNQQVSWQKRQKKTQSQKIMCFFKIVNNIKPFSTSIFSPA